VLLQVRRSLPAVLKLFFEIGRRLVESNDWPNWAEGNEFRAVRDSQRAGR
jgi:hypothetical protein